MNENSEPNLLRLSADSLSYITHYIAASDILALIITGNKTLISKLGPNGGVKELDIEMSPPSDLRWLPVISYFHQLRSFSCILRDNSFEYLINEMNLNLLSSGLRILRLSFPNVFSELLDPPISSKPKPTPPIRYFNLAVQFPLLEELTLIGGGKFYEVLSTVLPPKLVLLHLDGVMAHSVSPRFIDNLPRHIISLTLKNATLKAMERERSSFESRLDVSFPPELEELHLEAPWALKVSNSYPSTLRKLKVRYAQEDRNPSDFQFLPRSLESFDCNIASLSADALKLLPPSLIYLHVEDKSHTCRITEDLVEHLPPLLERSNLFSKNVFVPLIKLPRHLKRLFDSTELYEHGKTVGDLPQQLECLVFNSPLPASDIAKLPKTIVTLALRPVGRVDSTVWPTALRHAKLLDAPVGLCIPENFPLPLVSLTLSWAMLGRAPRGVLSPLTNLRTLEIRGLYVTCLNSLPDTLPAHITALRTSRVPLKWVMEFGYLKELKKLNLLDGLTEEDSQLGSEAFIKALPRSLTHLSFPTKIDFEKAHLISLPTDLRSLTVSMEPSASFLLNDEDMVHLPTFIKTVHLHGNAPHLTSAVGKLLPPFVTVFSANKEHNLATRRQSLLP